MIWEVPGVEVGHWSDHEARTGCTVVLCSPPAVASGEVRGSSPATREFALLDPAASIQRIDAVVLSGGSAFGLAAGQGVASWCEAHDRGYPTRAGRVPIVVGLSLFDLGVGDPSVRPGPAEGRAACDAAPSDALGAIGAGCGATVSKWRGEEQRVDGALVGAVERSDGLVVAALVAVNAWGDVIGVGPHDDDPPDLRALAGDSSELTNTTIGVVATNARLDKVGCRHLAGAAHDGLARSIIPPHSSPDGDAFVALATGTHDAPLDLVRLLTTTCVDRAIRSVGTAR